VRGESFKNNSQPRVLKLIVIRCALLDFHKTIYNNEEQSLKPEEFEHVLILFDANPSVDFEVGSG
jgi:hypothetical protein